MAEDDNRDSRSVSQDHDYGDSDHESLHEHPDGSAPGKPGRKKNPNSAAARRDQNRIAQREFRLRKQQRIRDLEARVEILSGNKEETFAELRNIVKDLMEENQHLRNLVRSLGNYIGDGLGGILPSMGFDRPQEFVDFINRAETDTAFEGYRRRKNSGQTAKTPGSKSSTVPSSNLGQKRSLDEDLFAQAKRMRSNDMLGNGAGDMYASMLAPNSPANGTTANGFNNPSGRSSFGAGSFSDFMQGQGTSSAMYMTGPTTGTGSPNNYPSPPAGPSFPPAFHPPIAVPSGLNNQNYPPNATATSLVASPTGPTPPAVPTELLDDDSHVDDPKLSEATKLIHYHLDNYKRNNAYCLPQSLRPTLVQRTVPHESVIDGIPHPEMRDRMILLRGRFDLVECLHLYVKSLTLHGDDVLAHNNWEIGEVWLRHYGYLVDQPVLNICNKWRRERGDKELLMSDIALAQPDMPTTS